jgi:hypothetical protein
MAMMRRVPFGWLLIFLVAILLLLAGGRLAPRDEETTYRMTANLIERGQLTLTQQEFTVEPQSYTAFLPQAAPRTQATTWIVPGPNGESYPLYTHAQPVLQIPLYLIGRLIGGAPLDLLSVAWTRFFVSLLNPIVIALTGWLIALFGSRWGFSARLSIGLGMMYSLGTMAAVYTHTNFSDPLLALLFMLAAYSAYRANEDRRGRWLLLTGVALGLALYLRERALIWLPLYLGYLLFSRRARTLRDWLAALVPIGCGAAALALWNSARFGSPVVIGYASWVADTGFEAPIIVGLFGLLISPGKGVLLYNPIVWLGLVGLFTMLRRRRAEAIFFLLFGATALFFYARYNFWTGGWNWGPRYLLPLLPFLLLAAGDWVHAHPTRLRRTLLIGACVLTLVLNLPALAVDQSRYLVSLEGRDPQHYLDRSILRIEDSPLLQQWPVAIDLAAWYARPETWPAAQQAIDQHLASYAGDGSFESLSTHLMWVDEFFRLNVPDLWFIHLPLLGQSPVIIALLALALLGVMVYSARKVWLMLR